VTVERTEAISHVLQSRGRVSFGQFEPAPVVGDLEAQLVGVLAQRHGDLCRVPAVLARVLDRLRAAVVHRGFQLRRVAADASGADGERCAGTLRDAFECGNERPIAQHGRIEPMRNIALAPPDAA
jgi:hypothetical protein